MVGGTEECNAGGSEGELKRRDGRSEEWREKRTELGRYGGGRNERREDRWADGGTGGMGFVGRDGRREGSEERGADGVTCGRRVWRRDGGMDGRKEGDTESDGRSDAMKGAE